MLAVLLQLQGAGVAAPVRIDEAAHSGEVACLNGGWLVCTPCMMRCQAKSINCLGEPACEPVAIYTRATRSARTTSAARSMMCGRLYLCDALRERLAQDLKDMAVERAQFIQKRHAVGGHRHVAWHRHVGSADQPHIRDSRVGARNGRVVTHAVRSPVRPATLWIYVVSMASARVIAGRMVVRWRASRGVNIAVSHEDYPLAVMNIERADSHSPVPFGHELAGFQLRRGLPRE